MAGRLRVLLDATAIPPKRGGVGRYVDGLVGALAERDDVETVVVHQVVDTAFEVLDIETVRAPARIAAPQARFAWEQSGLPSLVRRVGADILHSPHYTLPLAASCPVVVTVHDATFFSDPAWHSRVKGPFFRAWTRVASKRAAGLVVPSAATRDEMARHVSTDPEQFTVAPHGVDHTVFRSPDPHQTVAVRQELELDGDWVAFLGTLEPRKNVPALIAGWASVARAGAAPTTLVLAGGTGWDDAVEPAVAAVDGRDGLRVLRPGYLPIERLPALLGGAAAVAYPSLGEGFGLPVLEAMACGAAVLTTRRLSLPEVGGDAVAYCEPDPDGIGAGMVEMLCGDTVGLRRRAVVRAARFTWAAAAERHVAAYRRAAA